MTAPRSSTTTLIAALEVLARGIQSEDGVANAAIAEAAQRLAGLRALLVTAWPVVRIHRDREQFAGRFRRDEADDLYARFKAELESC